MGHFNADSVSLPHVGAAQMVVMAIFQVKEELTPTCWAPSPFWFPSDDDVICRILLYKTVAHLETTALRWGTGLGLLCISIYICKQVSYGLIPRFSGPKLSGKRSLRYIFLNDPSEANMNTGSFGPNSLISCLQIPQGDIGSSESLEIAIALNFLFLFILCS